MQVFLAGPRPRAPGETEVARARPRRLRAIARRAAAGAAGAGTGCRGCRTSGASLRRVAHSHPSAVALHESPKPSPSSESGLVVVLDPCPSLPSGTPAHSSEWEGVGTDDGAHRVAPGTGRDIGVGGRGRCGTPPTPAAPQEPWAGTGWDDRSCRRGDLVRDNGRGLGGGDGPRTDRRRPVDGW